MKTLFFLTTALIASALAHRGWGGGWGGGGGGGWGGGWGGGRGGGGGGGSKWDWGRGDGDGDGGRNRGTSQWWGTQTNPWAPTYVCPTTNRIIIISDYIKYGSVPSSCIGTCTFQQNAALSTVSTQNYDKTDSVIIMIGPYSFPNTAWTVLSNSTLMTELSTKTNVYLTTIPVATTITDQTVLNNVAAANALVQTARTTPGVHMIDYASYYNTYLKYTNTQWSALQMCSWIRDQLISAGVAFPSTVPAVPVVPVVPAVPAPAPGGILPTATLAPF